MFQFLNYKHRKSLLSNFKLQLLAWTVIINAQTSIYRQRAAVKKVSPHEERWTPESRSLPRRLGSNFLHYTDDRVQAPGHILWVRKSRGFKGTERTETGFGLSRSPRFPPLFPRRRRCRWSLTVLVRKTDILRMESRNSCAKYEGKFSAEHISTRMRDRFWKLFLSSFSPHVSQFYRCT